MQQRHYTKPAAELDRSDCETLIRLALSEDSPGGDITSESIFQETDYGRVRVIAGEEGILCGLPVVEFLLEIYLEITGKTVTLRPLFRDGLLFSKGDCLFEMEGTLISLLLLERIVLNFIQYLSGISTVTADAVKSAPENIVVIDTRKTLPGYRKLAKYAVFCGGGSNHRMNLSDMALIKDNHLAGCKNVSQAVNSVRKHKPYLPVEVEVENLEQLKSALECRPDVIMLDNMDLPLLKNAFSMIQKNDHPPFIEISGSMTPEKLAQLKEFGTVGVSMGYLTHTTRFLDISMEYAGK